MRVRTWETFLCVYVYLYVIISEQGQKLVY